MLPEMFFRRFLIPLPIYEQHDVLLKRYNAYIFGIFIIGTSPKHVLHAAPKHSRLFSPSAVGFLNLTDRKLPPPLHTLVA